MDLLFERFLSEERGEWPDIDLDLPSGDRRERVIQHMYEKYRGTGDRRAADCDDRERDHLSRPERRARSRARCCRSSPNRSIGLAKVMNHFEWVDPKDTLERNLREIGLDFQDPGSRTFGRCGSRSRICRAISASTPAAW
jgi:error-prone DNA polymerase